MNNEKLEEAKRLLKVADHMVYVTFPVLNENKLLIKITSQIYNALSKASEVIAERENIFPSKNPFKALNESSQKYGFNSSQLEILKEILLVMAMHSESPMEFSRREKLIILSEGLKTEDITIEKVKSYLTTLKDVINALESKKSFSSLKSN